MYAISLSNSASEEKAISILPCTFLPARNLIFTGDPKLNFKRSIKARTSAVFCGLLVLVLGDLFCIDLTRASA